MSPSPCVPVSLCFHVSLCASVAMCSPSCPSPCVPVSMCSRLCVSPSVYVSDSMCLRLCVSPSVYVSDSMCPRLCVSPSLCVSSSMCLRLYELFSPVQSAYRPNHSTETALVKIFNDLLLAPDDGKVSVLTLLDLSAAFDTIDHNILLHRLEHAFGIMGTALSWIRSYLSDRDQTVVVNGLKYEPFYLLYCP